jgi:thiol-disulfide isomerase/thioredoxin
MNRIWLFCVAALCATAWGCSEPATTANKKDGAGAGSNATESSTNAEADQADEADTEAPPSAGERLLAAFRDPPAENPLTLAFELDESLSRDDDDATRIANELLGVTRQAISDEAVADYVDAAAKENPTAAASLLVWVTRAQFISKTIVKQMPGRIDAKRPITFAVGRLVIADDKYSPADVMFQVPISSHGYFATEIGDRNGNLSFRAPGYEDVDAPLSTDAAEDDGGEAGAETTADATPIVVGDVTMKPLAADHQGTLRGRAALDDLSKAGSAKISLSLGMGPANTPHGGYSPRKSWPAPVVIAAGDDGAFEATGLNPSEYSVSITADDHAALRKSITVEPGETTDAGDLPLRSTDMGFYIGAEAPDAPELAWEKDFATALDRAKAENKPLFIMMTATWCGPCKMLERDSLANVWIRHFMKDMIVVQAFEEKAVEGKYGCKGYPTLVICDSAGEAKHKFVGYRPAIQFAGDLAEGFDALDADLPAELQTLVDKGLVGAN